MQVAKWGNSLAVRLPAAVVEALELKEGDQIEIRVADSRAFEVSRDQSRERALERLRKLRMPWKDLVEALDAFRILCPSPVPTSIAIHEAALKIAESQSFEIYDALVIAAALESGCATLYSEDLQHGQVINGKLTIRNPFK